jgi:hypothetical protein
MGFGALPLVSTRPNALTKVTRDTSPAALEEVLLLACEVRPVDAKASLLHIFHALCSD